MAPATVILRLRFRENSRRNKAVWRFLSKPGTLISNLGIKTSINVYIYMKESVLNIIFICKK